MKKQFEDIVKDICQVNNWKKPYTIPPTANKAEKQDIIDANASEREGAVGVACVLAYMQGCRVDEEAMSRVIGVVKEEVEEPLKRLILNGVFGKEYDIKNDKVLAGIAEDIHISKLNRKFKGPERTRNAWCLLAGIASGYCGLRD